MKKIIALMVTGIMLIGLTASAQLDDATYKAKLTAMMAEHDALVVTLPKTLEDQKAYDLRIAALPEPERINAQLANQLAHLKLCRWSYQRCLLGAEQQGQTADAIRIKATLARLETAIARWQKRIDTGKWDPPKLPPPVNK